MQAKFQGNNGVQLTLDIPLEDFLNSGVIYRQARAAMCDSGEDLLRDYVCESSAVYGDDEEMAQGFGEAVMLASGHAVHGVELDEADLLFARQRVCGGPGLQLVPGLLPLEA